ncbi:DUF4159 domain-containing protein [Euryhalocaulis caribicus]|uniref:DUF4159 domain-containing protein n=1 Tax=Euryhalocaulis caribicus TaxID=1161401 RepID=UPI0003A10A10|nr:DUF4159 domain-containing protein [Euryhalocaulis caribicus]
MLSLGPIAFAAPLALLGLLTLPVIWWLLRATPPPPSKVTFPPLRLLMGVLPDEEQPNRTPLWLVIFRMLIAAAIILGLARPILFPREGAEDAPLLLVVDDGWAAAQNWDRIVGAGRAYISDAQRGGQSVTLVFTAPQTGTETLTAISPGEARRRLDAHEPAPWPADREAAAQRIRDAALENGPYAAVWLSSGEGADAETLAETLKSQGALGQAVLVGPSGSQAPLALSPPDATARGFEVLVKRAGAGGERGGDVVAMAADGRLVARAPYQFEEGAREALARFDLPAEIRRRVALLRIPGSASAGTAQIIDDRWSRPIVGLAAQGAEQDSQPLLSDLFYLEKALDPFAETRRGAMDSLIESSPGVIAVVDAARIDDPEALAAYIEDGGVLLRFAGPRMAAGGDVLLPVTLREGGRSMGGALAWDEPQALAEFPESSPFAGLSLSEDITVERQVLAEPEPDLGYKTWARLQDGTPLVTAERVGRGWIVLFHVTANPEWSNLPLSGLFLEMLDRVSGLATAGGAGAEAGEGPYRLERAVNARGLLGAPSGDARPVPADAWPPDAIGPETPPGLYRRGTDAGALNVIGPGDTLIATPRINGVRADNYGERSPQRLSGLLLLAALVLLAADAIIALLLSGRMRGLTRRLRPGAAAMAAGLFAVALNPGPARAQDADEAAMAAALEMRLAYVETGDAEIDQMSRAGLQGLTRELIRRSAVEPAEPAGVTIGEDNLLLYPLLYWPVRSSERPLSPRETAALDEYIKAGGTVLFDTQDAGTAATRLGGGHQGLQVLLSDLDVPPLAPDPAEHVLTRSFYLLDDYPGRWDGGKLYVETDEASGRDGVSGIIIGSNDYAAAWAVDAEGRPIAAIASDDPRQREIAYRVGVNLVMYVLTGNYKADQVHVPALLERLGQ